MKISDCKIINLPKILDDRGNLTYIEENNHILFDFLLNILGFTTGIVVFFILKKCQLSY